MKPDTLLARRIELTYREFPMLALVVVATSMLFVFAVGNHVPSVAAGGWFAASMAILALRIRCFREFKAAQGDLARVARRYFFLLYGAAANGVLWSVAAWAYFLVEDGGDRLFVVVVVMGAAMIGAIWHVAIPWASILYLLPAMLPLGYAMLRDTGHPWVMAVAVGTVLLLIPVIVFHRSGRVVADWCIQTQRNEELAQGLEAAYAHLLAEIEQRERADEHGAISNRKLDLVLSQTPLATIEWDRDNKVIEWNPAAEDLFGYNRAEVVGRNSVLDLIFAAPLRERAQEQWRRLMEKREGGHIVIENLARDGRVLICSWALAPLFDADGQQFGTIAQAMDVTELRNYQQQLHSLAFFDTLTGLPNRALFVDRMGQSIADAAWHKNLMGLMLLDLDHFKRVNDTLGHVLGDRLLREAATRLNACVRTYDTVARLGGDEFAILLPEVRTGADLGNIAHKIVAAFAAPFRLEENELFVTCSIGIVFYPSDGSDETELLSNADSAMYFAKSQGRNNFQFYSAELTTKSAERIALDAHLRHAEENGELELHYQPQIDLASGSLIGAEALLRWNHPERGLVMPDKFIGIAEDSGLIVPIGEWVLRAGCRTARRWNEHRTGGVVRVAINLSPRQFRMNDLVGTLRRVLRETGCRPEWIECEITESLLLDDSDGIRAMLNEIHALGIALSIDDFGTGYSSLGYLNRYPVESIKIDRSFVRDIMTDSGAAELVKAIISMARSLRLKLVAEGVETQEQEAFLNAHGCHVGQGWLYGKAVSLEWFEAQLPAAGASWSESISRESDVDADGRCQLSISCLSA